MIAINHEQQKPEHKKLPELYDDLIALEPKPIATFVPVDSVEQKQLFLESESTNPNHYYGKLSGIDFEKRYSAIDTVASQILASPELNPKFSKAYDQTMRVMRGTDELPWFKDLAYYNGSNDVWKHLESIRGDDVKFMFVLMGKANPANIDHERLQYESSTP